MTKIEGTVGLIIKYGVIILAVLFAGFRLTEAVHANTEQARENIKTLESMSGRIERLEDWRVGREAYEKGYLAGLKETEVGRGVGQDHK